MARIVLDQLTRTFRGPEGREIRAVDHLDLAVEPGELLVLTGPSGCGKTTALRLIAGLEAPESGTISLDGRVINALEPKARDVAMVFQRPALYPEMSVFENIAFGLRLRKYPRAEVEQRVKEAAEVLGLASCLERLPMNLSAGQQQRTALGRAMVRRPKVLLLDEPLSNLDAPMRSQMRQELARLHERFGMTAIYVTHDQQEALALADRIAVIHAGTVLAVAPPATLYAQPPNLFVAGFIGSPTMNFVPGRIRSQGGDLVFEAEPVGSGGPLNLALAKDGFPALGHYLERQVILGIRPEDVIVGHRQNKTGPDESFPFIVDSVESAGGDVYVRLIRGGVVIVARIPSRIRLRRGDSVPLRFENSRVTFFDPASQLAIR